MKKEYTSLFVVAYLLLLSINILSQIWPLQAWIQQLSKSLLMPILMLWVIIGMPNPFPELAYVIFAALIFSWAGDVLLLFQNDSPGYFITGLISFLFAHLAYITFFVKTKKLTGGWRKVNIPIVMVVLAYGLLLLALLWKNLGEMKIPVLVYTICIITMLLTCLRAQQDLPKSIWIWLGMGAWLFVISDSLLAINKFLQPFHMAGPFIMITYGLAQLFIVFGIIRFFQAKTGATKLPVV